VQIAAKEADLQRQLAANSSAFEKQVEQLRAQLSAKDAELKKQLAAKDGELEKQAERLLGQLEAKDAEHEQKVTQVRKTAEAEAERLQRRTEAEVADLKATISRLEVDLMKVSCVIISHDCQSRSLTLRGHRRIRASHGSFSHCAASTRRPWQSKPSGSGKPKTLTRSSRRNSRMLIRLRTRMALRPRRYT
jgi:hypothetical protein